MQAKITPRYIFSLLLLTLLFVELHELTHAVLYRHSGDPVVAEF